MDPMIATNDPNPQMSEVTVSANGSTGETTSGSSRRVSKRTKSGRSVGTKRQTVSQSNANNDNNSSETNESQNTDNTETTDNLLSMPVLTASLVVTNDSGIEANEPTLDLNEANTQLNGNMNAENEANVCIDLTEDDSFVDYNSESDPEVQCISSVIRDQDLCIIRTNRRKGINRSPLKPNDDIIEIKDSLTLQNPMNGPNTQSMGSPSKRGVKKCIKCPVCLDESTVFDVSGRQLVSTTCGHLFCNELPVKSNRFEMKSECMRELNNQINSEMYASLVYMNMGAYFDSNKVARKGFAKFFTDQSHEEKEHAHKLVDYLNKRGANVNTLDVKMPVKNTWNNPKQALEDAIQLENEINDYIHKIHGIAEHTCLDPHLMDFLESEYLEEQMTSINQLTRLHTILSQMPDGVGEYLLDRQILEGKVEPKDL
ncbi:unnamed protein product [Medioppia subpectinata]|uniref:Ferritin n=1 Tax=Medioppia subpectinata TaxID=1979941 RepID=A0A7R9KH05_9ACAR|nr:unnamed protein product [Medioppia subpectinata]CAG2103389.1 unnamed protein product [Medioppia subpectinata]